MTITHSSCTTIHPHKSRKQIYVILTLQFQSGATSRQRMAEWKRRICSVIAFSLFYSVNHKPWAKYQWWHICCRCRPLCHKCCWLSCFRSHLHLITCEHCHCFQCTPCTGPGSRTGWSCERIIINSSCVHNTPPPTHTHSTDLLKEPIWRSLFITAPSTSPKKSPVWERSELTNRTNATDHKQPV